MGSGCCAAARCSPRRPLCRWPSGSARTRRSSRRERGAAAAAAGTGRARPARGHRPDPGRRQLRHLHYPNFQDIRERATTLSDVYAYRVEPQPISLSDGQEAERIYGVPVSGNYFRALGTTPARGRLLNDDDDRPAVPGRGDQLRVVAAALRRRARDTVGRTVTFNSYPVDDRRRRAAAVPGDDGDARRHVGAAERSPRSSRRVSAPRCSRTGGASWLVMGGRLKPGVTVAQANAEMASDRTRAREGVSGREPRHAATGR